MLPILCGIGCAVLVILDIAGKLHPERTRSQVLLHLFSLVGALFPLAVMVWVYVLFPDQTDSNPVLQVLRYLYDLPAPLSFLPKPAMAFCAMTWCYIMVRTCSCIPISQTGSTPQQAAKQRTAGTDVRHYFPAGNYFRSRDVGICDTSDGSAPAAVSCRPADSLCHGHCLRQPVPDRLCSLSGLEKALANLFAGGHVSAVAAVDRDSDHYGKDAENTLSQNASANGIFTVCRGVLYDL